MFVWNTLLNYWYATSNGIDSFVKSLSNCLDNILIEPTGPIQGVLQVHPKSAHKPINLNWSLCSYLSATIYWLMVHREQWNKVVLSKSEFVYSNLLSKQYLYRSVWKCLLDTLLNDDLPQAMVFHLFQKANCLNNILIIHFGRISQQAYLEQMSPCSKATDFWNQYANTSVRVLDLVI